MKIENALPMTATKSWRLIGGTFACVPVFGHLLMKMKTKGFCAGARRRQWPMKLGRLSLPMCSIYGPSRGGESAASRRDVLTQGQIRGKSGVKRRNIDRLGANEQRRKAKATGKEEFLHLPPAGDARGRLLTFLKSLPDFCVPDNGLRNVC